MTYPDALLRDILSGVRRIALVGLSPSPERPSHRVARFLIDRGYTVIPVNPAHAGGEILGQPVRASLTAIGDRVDMVDIFRRSEAVPAIVDEALEALPGLRVIWMQLGVTHAEAAARAEARGITVIQDRCPKIEHTRLFGS